MKTKIFISVMLTALISAFGALAATEPVTVQYEDFDYNSKYPLHNRFSDISGTKAADAARGFSSGWILGNEAAVSGSDGWILKSENPYLDDSGNEIGYGPYYLKALKNSTARIYRAVAEESKILPKPASDGENVYYISWEQYVGEGVILSDSMRVEFNINGVAAGFKQIGDDIFPYMKWTEEKYGAVAAERGKTYKFVLRLEANNTKADRVSLKAFEKSTGYKQTWDIDFEISANVAFSYFGLASATVNQDTDGDEDVRFANYKAELFSGEAAQAAFSAEAALDSFKATFDAQNKQTAEAAIDNLGECELKSMLSAELKCIEDVQYEKLLQRRRATIVPTSEVSSQTILSQLKTTAKSATQYKDTMLKEADVLWEGDNYTFGETTGVTLYNAYSRIATMAKAYAAEGSQLKGDTELKESIVYALDFLNTNAFYDGIDLSDRGSINWWYYEIGIPLNLSETLIMLDGEIDEGLKQDIAAAILYFVSYPTNGTFGQGSIMEGTNLVWKCSITADIGILTKNAELIKTGVKESETLLSFAEDGENADGFYRDGSFLQHGNVAYNGGYGTDALSFMAELTDIFRDTPFAYDTEKSRILYNWVYNSYDPLIYDGAMLDMVRGRYICRYALSSFSTGISVLGTVYTLSVNAPEPDKQRLENIIRRNLKTDESKRRFIAAMPINYVESAEKFLKTEAEAESIGETAKIFGRMDRAIYKTDNYLFGISMASDRISKFESVNGENLKGWYTGYGATYLQNGNYMHYSKNYWNTVNPYELGGITVTDRTLKRGEFAYVKYTDEAYAGGAVLDDKYAAVGMKLKDFEDSSGKLAVKKAWFMMDNMIAALGSGIGGSNRRVKTVVDTRVIAETDDVVLNGITNSFGGSFSVSGPEYAHIGGENNIGYYFPEKQNISIKSEQRTGAWSDIRNDADKTIQTNNYASIVIDHGTNPENARYQYIILPERTKEETVAYSNSPDMSILENTENAASVRSNISGTTGICFWENTEYKSDIVTSDSALSLVYSEKDGEFNISISDPEQKDGYATVILDIDISEILSYDERMEITEEAEGVKIKIMLDGLCGESVSAKFSLTGVYLKENTDTLSVIYNGGVGVYVCACYDSEGKMSSVRMISEDFDIATDDIKTVKILHLESIKGLAPLENAKVYEKS